MKAFLCVLSIICFAGCMSPPRPTGDSIRSVSWVNPSPHPFRLVDTTLCGSSESVVLNDLPAYAEKALEWRSDLYPNCKVTLTPVIGTTVLDAQTNWIPPPDRLSSNRTYHLRITVNPGAPPGLTLEPTAIAERRLEAAGRIIETR